MNLNLRKQHHCFPVEAIRQAIVSHASRNGSCSSLFQATAVHRLVHVHHRPPSTTAVGKAQRFVFFESNPERTDERNPEDSPGLTLQVTTRNSDGPHLFVL